MLIRSRKPWDVIDYKTTDENVYLNRRSFLRAMGLAGAGLASAPLMSSLSSAKAARITGFPAMRNLAFTLDRPITLEEEATTYNNFYEFGSSFTRTSMISTLSKSPISGTRMSFFIYTFLRSIF